jgi:hypothetical protein
LAKAVDDREQAIKVVRREHRRRLIHDQDTCVESERLGYLDDLLLANRQGRNESSWVQLDAEILEETASLAPPSSRVQQPEPISRLAAQKDVLSDRQVGEQSEFLIDRGDP